MYNYMYIINIPMCYDLFLFYFKENKWRLRRSPCCLGVCVFPLFFSHFICCKRRIEIKYAINSSQNFLFPFCMLVVLPAYEAANCCVPSVRKMLPIPWLQHTHKTCFLGSHYSRSTHSLYPYLNHLTNIICFMSEY
jgi:hypothetical protein